MSRNIRVEHYENGLDVEATRVVQVKVFMASSVRLGDIFYTLYFYLDLPPTFNICLGAKMGNAKYVLDPNTILHSSLRLDTTVRVIPGSSNTQAKAFDSYMLKNRSRLDRMAFLIEDSNGTNRYRAGKDDFSRMLQINDPYSLQQEYNRMIAARRIPTMVLHELGNMTQREMIETVLTQRIQRVVISTAAAAEAAALHLDQYFEVLPLHHRIPESTLMDSINGVCFCGNELRDDPPDMTFELYQDDIGHYCRVRSTCGHLFHRACARRFLACDIDRTKCPRCGAHVEPVVVEP